MRHLLKRLLLAFSLLAAIAPAYSRELLVVGTEFASVYERSASGEFSGLGVEIVRAIARQTGDTVKFEIYPWARAQFMVEQDQAHILVGPYKTAEREARFFFAARGFYRDYMVFYVRNSGGANLQWDGNYQSMRGYRVGVVNGWVYGAKFESMRPSLKPEVANSLTNALNMLNARRIDYLASNLRNTEALLKSMGLASEFAVLDQIIDTQDGYLAFCKKSACDALRTQFDHAFEQLRTSGELAKMARSFNVRIP
ncbi:MAG: transporter substrate-binding domain-containing protein [Pseudomonadota bacterium]